MVGIQIHLEQHVILIDVIYNIIENVKLVDERVQLEQLNDYGHSRESVGNLDDL